jgi:RNA polymerase sigma factor (sigma-70 family)
MMNQGVPGGSRSRHRLEERQEFNGAGERGSRAVSFEEAWSRHRRELHRRALDWTNGRREDAEDAMSLAAMAALQKFPPNLPAAAARPWLLRLLHNKCMDLYRERRRTLEVSIESDEDQPGCPEPASAATFETVLLDHELASFVRKLIDGLPTRLRSVAELHLVGELEYAEIAETLAISAATARKRMQHARSLLRPRLRAYLEGGARLSLAAERPPDTVDAGAPRAPVEDGVTGRRAPRGQQRPRRATSRRSTLGLREYIRRHPRGWRMRWELALRLREMGLLEEAVSHLEAATSRQPRCAGIWIELARVFKSLGRAAEAADACRMALRWARDEETRRQIDLLSGTGCDRG